MNCNLIIIKSAENQQIQTGIIIVLKKCLFINIGSSLILKLILIPNEIVKRLSLVKSDIIF